MAVESSGAEPDDRPFRSAANGSRQVQKCARTISTRENEAPQRRQLAFESIDPVFETLDIHVGHGDLRHPVGNLLSGSARRAPMAKKSI